MAEQRFQSVLKRVGKGGSLALPFDPDAVWGVRGRHHITGTVNGCGIRGPLKKEASDWTLPIGPAWLRDNALPDSGFEVVLRPEGPQADALSEDIATALDPEPDAKAFFAALPTFYRKGYLDWIESAKRPATRETRIRETVAALKEGKKQR
ncbi:hypothetical protein EON81_10030 [bacterium]|nr:MAG: hypothetical protein EON81_10030 [bacterium]